MLLRFFSSKKICIYRYWLILYAISKYLSSVAFSSFLLADGLIFLEGNEIVRRDEIGIDNTVIVVGFVLKDMSNKAFDNFVVRLGFFVEILNADFSVAGISRDKQAAIQTPCARPNFNIDCAFCPKNGASMASSSG